MRNILRNNNKIIITFILIISFIFILNSNETFAKTISFNLKDGAISIIKDTMKDEDTDNEEDKIENDENDGNDGNIEIDIDKDENDKTEDDTIKDGAYIIACAKNPNYVLDIENISLKQGENLHIWTRTGVENQRFYIEKDKDGYYKIMNIGSALTIDVENGSKKSGTNIRQWENNDSSAQRWKIVKNEDGTYSFIAKCSGKALDVYSAIFENGTNVQQYDINNSDAQKFNLEKTDLIKTEIVSIRKALKPEMVLDIDNNLPDDGIKLQLWEENNTLAQRFEIYKVGENEVRIRTASSGGWLTETGTENGSTVVQLGDSNTPVNDANTWIVNWNNGITFKNKESGLYLDIDANGTKNGTKVQVWKEISNQVAQRFLVNKADLVKNGWYILESNLGNVMDLDNFGSDWGTNIITWKNGNQSNQKFRFEKKTEGYVIYTMHNLALDVENGSIEDGANIRQWEDNGALCQRWIPEIRDDGYVAIKNCNSGKYIDIANGSEVAGSNVEQATGNTSNSQKWKLTSTIFGGWVSRDGNMYCYDPQNGQLVTNCTRVDPMMTDPAQYGSIYDFDSEGRATWHLPVESDLSGGTGVNAPIPTVTGDRRQRVIQMALSRISCPYVGGRAPTGFVCDGLTAWSYTVALGDWFYTGEGSREDLQDASWQWEKIEVRNGIKYNISELKSGDLVFFGNSQLTQGPGMIDYNGEAYHAGIYYRDNIMINARSEGGVGYYSVSGYYMKWLGGGSPYEAETSRVEIHR